MDDTESQYHNHSEYSLRKRSVPKHPKGFVNEWGALLQHQSEVQMLLEQEQQQKEHQKKQKFRQELDKQLNGFREKALEMDKEKHDFEQRKILEQNNTVFKQREQLTKYEERENTRRMMNENMEQLRQKREQEKRQDDQEKFKFNSKNQHDQMYESLAKTHEELQKMKQKQDLQDWYKDEAYRKHQVQQMIREKEKFDHQNFINHVDNNHIRAVKDHHDTVDKHAHIREFKTAVGYAPDERQYQKQQAIETMKKQWEERQQEENKRKQMEEQQRKQQKEHIVDTYKFQMEKRKQDQTVNKIEEQVYGTVLKSSIDTLNQMDQQRKISQKYQTKEYADQLKRQIDDFKDRELKKYNEMSDRERQLNIKPLVAYENMQSDIYVKQLPGFDRNNDKDNYRRYNRKGISNALLGQLGEATETMSLLGDRRGSPFENGGALTARDNQNRQSMPLLSSRMNNNDNLYTTQQGRSYKLDLDLKPTAQVTFQDQYNNNQQHSKTLQNLQQEQNKLPSALQSSQANYISQQKQSYIPTAIEQASMRQSGALDIQKPLRRNETVGSLFGGGGSNSNQQNENKAVEDRYKTSSNLLKDSSPQQFNLQSSRVRGNSSGGMSSIFGNDDKDFKQQEEERKRQIEEKRKRDIENKTMGSIAGIPSVLKNVELSRYHEEPQVAKSNYRQVQQNSDFLTHRENPPQQTRSLLSDIKKPEIKKPELQEFKSIGLEGSRTERLGNQTTTNGEAKKTQTLEEMMDLLKYNKELDKRVIGTMKADNIQEGTKKVFYGKDERITPLQHSARQHIH
ncbi:UNKNOWN [Stylonychia lemnae]|uniref:Uncharacterized protein n=1 Tax=Stylonychia lemnae TaxID=5949 RepID=A0A078A1H5_STYLE|nr:UNKNOWN [Stylonychia lemnae]|eukprot:CDW75955.1 UNKNOWN [Stylonychia lemnae]